MATVTAAVPAEAHAGASFITSPGAGAAAGPDVTRGDPWSQIPELVELSDVLGGLGRLPLLSAEEEVALAREAEAGALAEEALKRHPSSSAAAELTLIASQGRAAFQRLVLANVRLVAWLARRRICGGGCPLTYTDLVNEGLTGLIRAAHKWDYQRGLKFSTYAVPWIRATQQRAERRARGLGPLIEQQRTAIRHARADLIVELGRAPTEREVSLRVGLSAARIAELEAMQGWGAFTASLDSTTNAGEGGRTLQELLPDASTADPAELVAAAEEHALLREQLARLPQRQRVVLVQHFGLDGNPAADVATIARRCGVPQQRVAATLAGALENLRSTLQACATDDSSAA